MLVNGAITDSIGRQLIRSFGITIIRMEYLLKIPFGRGAGFAGFKNVLKMRSEK